MAESLADDIVGFMRLPQHAGIKVDVDVEERFSPDVARGVREGHASLGITWDTVDLQGLQTTAYRTDHLGIVVTAHHSLTKFKKLEFAQTLGWEQVSMPSTSAVQVLLERAAAQRGSSLRSRAMVSTLKPGCVWSPKGGTFLAMFQIPNKFFTTNGDVTDMAGTDWESIWGSHPSQKQQQIKTN